MQNFAFPYFSRDIAEFWRRWHISLSTWFRDYLYIPLGGSRGGTLMKVRNTFIIFIVSGFWHGANWTFIVWGVLNALYILPLLLTKKNRDNLDIVAQSSFLPNIKDLFNMTFTFMLSVFAWIFFRAENISHALNYTINIFSVELFSKPQILEETTGLLITPLTIPLLIVIFVLVEWCGRENNFAIEKIVLKWNGFIRYSFYSAILLAILWYAQGKEQTFIYFQF
jgi:D-alanyl-lipoteichoic acid acyltransferase DltB (MBOAT superfamily)